MVLPLRFRPDPVLSRKAPRVKKVDAAIRRLIDDMLETMHHNHGVGLAANQVGRLQRVAVIQLPEQEPIVLINPRIIQREGEREVEEGCLSIPGYQGLVKRSVKVCVSAEDVNGRPFRIEAENDLLAQALEHEIDHLDGVLYVQRLVNRDAFWKLEPEPEAEGAQAGPHQP